jgi:hypothetical protein
MLRCSQAEVQANSSRERSKRGDGPQLVTETEIETAETSSHIHIHIKKQAKSNPTDIFRNGLEKVTATR